MNPLKVNIVSREKFNKKKNISIFEENEKNSILGNVSQLFENPMLQNSFLNNKELMSNIKQKISDDI